MLGSSSTIIFLEVGICPADLTFVVVVDDTPISANSIDLIFCCVGIEGASLSVESRLWHFPCGRAVRTQCLMSRERFEDTIDVPDTSR